MDIKQNLTNVRIYDCMDLSLCQVHCCKYGEQIKKRPCCHSIVHFYIVFSTKRKIVHKMFLYNLFHYTYTQTHLSTSSFLFIFQFNVNLIPNSGFLSIGNNIYGNILKDFAIKVLIPNIKKIFNDEIEALMLLAYIIESLVKKTKRLKLVDVVFLLKEITNHEMDLRFEAAAANEFYENTINDAGFKIPKIYWKFTSDNVLTLDWIDAISIREVNKIKSFGVNIKSLAKVIIQHFLRHAVRDGYFHADMHQGNLLIDRSLSLIHI